MTDDERQRAERYDEDCAAAERVLWAALNYLLATAKDFGDDSQQAFMLAMRAVNDARDNLWYVMSRDDEVNT